jgi:hypothetical protein
MTIARSPAQVIAGEAVSGTPQERWNDMLNIASTMYNRAVMTGVPISDISSVQSQYNAYGQPLPSGTASYVDMAQQALDYVAANGPVNKATFYATPAAVNNLPPGLEPVTSDTGHVFFSDPQFRSILTAQGVVTPDPSQLGGVPMPGAAIPEARPTTTTPDLSKTGLLGALFSSDPNAPSVANGFSPLAAATPVSAPLNVTATGLVGTPNLDASAKVGAPLSNSGWQTMADAGPMGGYPASPLERMGPQNPNDFQAMAFASPIQAPLGVTGALGPMSQPDLSAQASVPGLLSSAPSAASTPSMFAGPSMAGQIGTVAQQGLLSGMQNAANAYDQQAMSTPMLSQAMSPSYPALSQPVDTGALSTNSPLASPTVDPSVNASLNSLASAYSAAPTTDRFASAPATFDATRFGAPDINMAMDQSIANSVAASPATPSVPSVSSATPTTSGLLSGYQATPNATPAENAISGILSQPSAPSSFDMQRFAPSIDPATNTQSFYDANWTSPAAVASYNAMSNLDTSSIATPTDLGTSTPGYNALVAATFPDSVTTTSVTPSATTDTTVPGPATTPAVTQQTMTPPANVGAVTAPSTTGGFFNKGTIIGGLLGGAVAGPVGGILGGLLGNKINQGGLTGLLGGSQPMAINQIGGGMANLGSIWGGAMPAGTQAIANNGDRVTSLGGGWTSVTNKYGVTTSFGPNMVTAAHFGPSLTDHTTNSGPGGSPSGIGGAAY